eukprot:NODE_489_length_7778_cov_0.178409.p3 type:complete len:422 gc:universal NODE_489_length_7778_cov_0.178409:7372-6107(-)
MHELQIDSISANKSFYRRKYTDLGPEFSQFHYEQSIYNDGVPVQMSLEARMDKGFFTANNFWTCYRRNYFQLSTSLQLLGEDSISSLENTTVMINNTHCKVIDFYVNLVAKVASTDKNIELVQHTAKRDKGPQRTPQAKKITIGGSLSNINSLTSAQSIACFDRIQFKSATANNGKRRAQQQFFMLILEVLADVEVDGNVVQKRIGFAISDHLVVRGRSPGHYSDTQAERAMGGPMNYENYGNFNDGSSGIYYAPYSPKSIGMQSNNGSLPPSPTKLNAMQIPSANGAFYTREHPPRPSSAPMDYYDVEVPSLESLEQFSTQMQKIQEQMSQQMSNFATPSMNHYNNEILQHLAHNDTRSASSSLYLDSQLYYMDPALAQQQQQQQQQQQALYYSMSAPVSRSVSPFQMEEIPENAHSNNE